MSGSFIRFGWRGCTCSYLAPGVLRGSQTVQSATRDVNNCRRVFFSSCVGHKSLIKNGSPTGIQIENNWNIWDQDRAPEDRFALQASSILLVDYLVGSKLKSARGRIKEAYQVGTIKDLFPSASITPQLRFCTLDILLLAASLPLFSRLLPCFLPPLCRFLSPFLSALLGKRWEKRSECGFLSCPASVQYGNMVRGSCW